MPYSTGILRHRVTILNREGAQDSTYGLDSSGIDFKPAGTVWASVDYAKGKSAMNAGSLDVYAVIMVRMRWNAFTNERSRIVYEGKTYQVLGDMFHADYEENTIQFHAQLLINDYHAAGSDSSL